MQRLRRQIGRSQLDGVAHVVDGTLTEHELALRIAAADVAALPFELVPSDAPLSVLEARALGVPVVTTRLGCLPELAAGDDALLAHPGDPRSLCEALLAAVSRSSDRLGSARCGGARAKSGPHSWDEVGAQWSALVARL
jgi:glycosyltransferase involved in cell wall biosynthesis